MNEPGHGSASRYEISVAVTEGGRTYTLEQVALATGLHPDLVRHYCQIGLLGAAYTTAEAGPEFDDDALYWLRRIERVRRQHGLDRAALPLICQLWREIERLETEVRFLRGP